ncbi:MAG: hypothetical protein NTW29_11935 [Bacteroidetes bacterium]|nr:hypothetical protein [Bacteroidota bacterium]
MIQLLNIHVSPGIRRRKCLSLVILTGLYIFCACTPVSSLYAQQRKAVEIVHIQPFQLQNSYKFDWRLERPDVSNGLLVVFKVDTSLVRPTNALEPVLYAGNHTVQRLNQGYESGYVIGIIPEEIDLSKEPVWFGNVGLPEQIDAKMIRAERAKANNSGIRPRKAEEIRRITMEKTAVVDLTTLLRKYAADLILQYAPQDKYLVEAWRLPETGK